jgi:hypothetical protein
MVFEMIIYPNPARQNEKEGRIGKVFNGLERLFLIFWKKLSKKDFILS